MQQRQVFITVKWPHLWACVDTLFTDKNGTKNGKKGVGSPIKPFICLHCFSRSWKRLGEEKATKDNDINILWVQRVSFAARLWGREKSELYTFGVSSWCFQAGPEFADLPKKSFRFRIMLTRKQRGGDGEQLPLWAGGGHIELMYWREA